MKNFLNKFKYLLIGVGLAIAGTVVAVNVSVPQATQKGDLATGLTTGNYQLLHPGSNGTVLTASSTAPNGLTYAAGVSAATAWGTITGTLSGQTDLQTALNAKLSTTTAASTYQLQGNYHQ